MRELSIGKRRLPLTEEGFLQDPEMWDEEVARRLAAEEGIELTEAHWEILHLLRDHFHRFGQPPPNTRLFVFAVRKALGPEKGSSRYLHRLFGENPLRRAARLAGLPKPPHCL